MGAAAVAAEIVRAWQVASRLSWFQRHSERPSRIRAAIDRDVRIERQQPAAFVGMGSQPVLMLSRVSADHQMLAAVLDIAERPPEFQRQPRHAELFRLQDTFVAERSEEIRRDYAHPPLVDAEKLRQADADDVRDLGRGI